ncbi:MAG: PspA/IM30 family protein, partial [Candidatus Methanofastidiosia archaeon]
MGILSRILNLINSKLNKILKRVESPKESLDLGYERMRENLKRLEKSVVDVATSKKKLELSKERLEENVERYGEQ